MKIVKHCFKNEIKVFKKKKKERNFLTLEQVLPAKGEELAIKWTNFGSIVGQSWYWQDPTIFIEERNRR